MLTGKTTLVGLIGNPVESSMSPVMQNAAFAACGLDWAYLPLLVEEGRLADALKGLVALGFAGANVTAPYKQEAAELCESDLPSVNTLVVRDGRIESHSTDTAILDGLPAQRAAIVGGGGVGGGLPGRAPARTDVLAQRRAGRPTSPRPTSSSTRPRSATRSSPPSARVRR